MPQVRTSTTSNRIGASTVATLSLKNDWVKVANGSQCAALPPLRFRTSRTASAT